MQAYQYQRDKEQEGHLDFHCGSQSLNYSSSEWEYKAVLNQADQDKSEHIQNVVHVYRKGIKAGIKRDATAWSFCNFEDLCNEKKTNENEIIPTIYALGSLVENARWEYDNVKSFQLITQQILLHLHYNRQATKFPRFQVFTNLIYLSPQKACQEDFRYKYSMCSVPVLFLVRCSFIHLFL